jgi:hypothetical protein
MKKPKVLIKQMNDDLDKPSLYGGTHRDQANRVAKRYWYLWYIGECPVCGKDKSYRERKYTSKPKNREDRIKHMTCEETYCGCVY